MSGFNTRKISVSSILLIAIILMILFEFHFLYIVPYPAFLNTILAGNKYYVVTGVLALLWTLICLLTYKNIFGNDKYFYRFAFGFGIDFLIECLYSYASGDPINSILGSGGRLLAVYFAFPIYVIFIKKNSYKELFDFISVISLIWEIILIVGSIRYSSTGSLIFDLNSYFYQNYITTRNGSIRMAITALGNISVIYNFFQLIFKKNNSAKKAYYLTALIIGLFCAIVIQQTRMYLLALVAAALAMLLAVGGTWKKQLAKIGIFTVLIIFIFRSNYISQLVHGFLDTSLTSDSSWSNQSHLYGYGYYWNTFIHKPIFGNGFLSEVDHYSLIHGTSSLFGANYNDCGIIGLLAETGLMSVFFFVIPVIRMTQDIIYHNLKFRNTSILATGL